MKMYSKILVFLIVASLSVHGKGQKCNHQFSTMPPSVNNNLYKLEMETKKSNTTYTTAQTYVLTLKALNSSRPFREFKITVEDPDMDGKDFDDRDVNVGTLKTLDTDRRTTYSAVCHKTVVNAEKSDKEKIEVHWVSPKQSQSDQRVRIRAMVAENDETWYVGNDLTIELAKDKNTPRDTPVWPPIENCYLCSEARYEVIFQGKWSRLTHPRHYPSKPDTNGYSHMIGASHAYNFTLWKEGQTAANGIEEMAAEGDISVIERHIITNISPDQGTRTLIRGKRHFHPHMFEPSYSLFRADSVHHLFSLVVSMRPSPDWFLGTTQFELCSNEHGWLEESELPLFPWDAGVRNGVAYESKTSRTEPRDAIDRVDIGSFDRASPFYQMNLDDLKPFATLKVRLLDVYPLIGIECPNEAAAQPFKSNQEQNSQYEEPQALKSQPFSADSCEKSPREWGQWSSCVPDDGTCGIGVSTRVRVLKESDKTHGRPSLEQKCENSEEYAEETQDCFVKC